MSTTTEIGLALLFSSFYFIIVPALGIATGAVAGRLTPTVSTGRGALVGLASGVLAVGFGFLLDWVIYDLSRFGPSSPLGLMMFFTPPPPPPPTLAIFAPPVVLQIIRMRRGKRK